MSETETTVLIVVVVAVLLAAAAAAYLMRKRAQEQHAREASQLRDVAVTHTHEVTEAELARAEAERAESEAARARQGLAQTEATREHLVREADRIDPHVDTAHEEYAPTDPGEHRDGVAPGESTPPTSRT